MRWLAVGGITAFASIACSSTATPTPTVPPTLEQPTPIVATREPDPTPTPVPSSAWVPVAPMNVGRTSYSAARMQDGKIMVVGGLGRTGVLKSVEVYDPELDTWTVLEGMSSARRDASLVTLADGRIVAAGGRNILTIDSSEIFDPSTGRWTELPRLNVGRERAMGVPLDDGRLLLFSGGNSVIGGDDGQFELKSAEIFDPKVNEWSAIEPLKNAETSWEGWVKLDDGRVFLLGGDFARPNRFVQIFDPSTDSWQEGPGLDKPSGGGAAVLLPDGRVMVAGGGLRCCLLESLLFDPQTETLEPGPDMLTKRGGHIGLTVPDGRAVFLFGLNPDFPFDDPYRHGEVFDPVSGEWQILAEFPGRLDEMNPPAVLPDGSILLGGGRSVQALSDGSAETVYLTDMFRLKLPTR